MLFSSKLMSMRMANYPSASFSEYVPRGCPAQRLPLNSIVGTAAIANRPCTQFVTAPVAACGVTRVVSRASFWCPRHSHHVGSEFHRLPVKYICELFPENLMLQIKKKK